MWIVVTPVAAIGIAFSLLYSCSDKSETTASSTCAKGASLTANPPPKGGGGKAPGGGSSESCSTEQGSKGSSGSTGDSCALTEDTTATATENAHGCALLTRDTSSCLASREAQGLSGFWLKFSCNVTLTKSGSNVILTSNNLPDHKSFYFSSTDPCYETFTSTSRAANPNQIASQTITMTVPYEPTAASSTTEMSMGVVGMALNGVAIYSNAAAPGDDIYAEEATFDKCDGHPDNSSRYHYHSEPSAITNEDAAFVGVMRDGFPIYGRNDYETDTAATDLDTAGGKIGKTVDSPESDVYHYQVNLQTNGTDSLYFLTAGHYKGTAGSCTGCQ